MNDSEDKASGTAAVLESYLRLAGLCAEDYAGICKQAYEVVTPMEIRDGILRTGEFDLLWVPHWQGDDGDGNGNSTSDGVDIVNEVKLFVESGKGLLAQCVSITELEHYGRFLTDYGLGHNGGTRDPNTIEYVDVTSANAQIGDVAYEPEDGSLHSFRPYVFGDPIETTPAPEVTAGNPSTYNATVSRFAADNTGWDYYVGGYAFGDTNYGYVAYLGGHQYASCKSGGKVDPEPNVHTLELELAREITTEAFTLLIKYNSGSSHQVTFTKDNLPAASGNPLEIDLIKALVHNDKIFDVTLRNTNASTITVDSITLSWEFGAFDQKLERITDNKVDTSYFDDQSGVPSGFEAITADFTLDSAGGGANAKACNENDDCTWKNIAGVRYVLNTVFNIRYQLESTEYVRSAPIVKHPYLYQGSFQYPSYYGHFRKYDVTREYAQGEEKVAVWDTADPGHIPDANNDNIDGRKVYTAELSGGNWTNINFDVGNLNTLDVPLDVTPGNGDSSDEAAVIARVRGKNWDDAGSHWVERPNKLGGIMHSAPAIVADSSRFSGSRDEIAYVGDLYGMLHAIETATGNEKWAFIPNNLLGKLKNDRTDPNAVQEFAAVDGSPAVTDVFYDHDGINGKEWRTILVCPEGWGGNYIFALDVTDPDNWSVLWELTVEVVLKYSGLGGFSAGVMLTGQTSGATGQVVDDDTDEDELTLKEVVGPFQNGETVFVDIDGNGVLDAGELNITADQVLAVEMGHAYRASVNKVKWPVNDDQGNITGYEQKWVVYVATGYLNIAEDHGGINVFAFDLVTGDKLWHFSDRYLSAVNDIPGAVTLFDTTGDNLMDRVYVGDMDGRLWELDAVDGTNPNGTVEVEGVTKEMPLWNAGVGKPISVSPAIIRDNGHVFLVFGTGGTDWAANDQAYSIYALDATHKQTSPAYWDSVTGQGGTATLRWELPLAAGEKVWSAPTIAAGRIFLATASGTMESDNPRQDLAGAGKIYSLNLEDGSLVWSIDNIGKARGSIYVDRQHVYLTTVNNQIRQFGDDVFPADGANNVVLKAWRELW
jgi:hypothetical protein